MCIHSLYFDTFCTIYISIFKYILIFFLFIHHVYPLAVLLQGHPNGLPIAKETFAKYGHIDHLWVINPLEIQ